ncbi:MAG: hypothetical protein M0R06_00325 [Sphaerochaeta sp.]|nr:hypothetical protein [Sphaerochaeta sp.]
MEAIIKRYSTPDDPLEITITGNNPESAVRDYKVVMSGLRPEPTAQTKTTVIKKEKE